jgi:hypothetical protein
MAKKAIINIEYAGGGGLNRAQMIAAKSLEHELQSRSYEVKYIGRFSAATTALSAIEIIGLYIAARVGDKALGNVSDELTKPLIAWAKRTLKLEKQNLPPPPTQNDDAKPTKVSRYSMARMTSL